ncbi:hypothetical protein PAPHI01_1473 [Pancytospora philotis]|nr:hypothetical protein PAPHI01_1473 [Pancytospora philotis]
MSRDSLFFLLGLVRYVAVVAAQATQPPPYVDQARLPPYDSTDQPPPYGTQDQPPPYGTQDQPPPYDSQPLHDTCGLCSTSPVQVPEHAAKIEQLNLTVPRLAAHQKPLHLHCVLNRYCMQNTRMEFHFTKWPLLGPVGAAIRTLCEKAHKAPTGAEMRVLRMMLRKLNTRLYEAMDFTGLSKSVFGMLATEAGSALDEAVGGRMGRTGGPLGSKCVHLILLKYEIGCCAALNAGSSAFAKAVLSPFASKQPAEVVQRYAESLHKKLWAHLEPKTLNEVVARLRDSGVYSKAEVGQNEQAIEQMQNKLWNDVWSSKQRCEFIKALLCSRNCELLIDFLTNAEEGALQLPFSDLYDLVGHADRFAPSGNGKSLAPTYTAYLLRFFKISDRSSLSGSLYCELAKKCFKIRSRKDISAADREHTLTPALIFDSIDFRKLDAQETKKLSDLCTKYAPEGIGSFFSHTQAAQNTLPSRGR